MYFCVLNEMSSSKTEIDIKSFKKNSVSSGINYSIFIHKIFSTYKLLSLNVSHNLRFHLYWEFQYFLKLG